MPNSVELSHFFNDVGLWAALITACVGTYLWRGLGVFLSGKISQDSEIFKWLSAVTYAMVAALTVRIILLPVGLLSTVPIWIRLLVTIASVAVMLSRPGKRMVPALLTGTIALVLYGFLIRLF
jgi:branched-subunit amino acid transport protein